jgi:hypothetical protein
LTGYSDPSEAETEETETMEMVAAVMIETAAMTETVMAAIVW